MPKKVTPVPTGIWKQVARLQRVGLSEGLRGRGGTWLAMGIGAWGLQRLRGMAAKEDEILLREPIGPGETITITNQTTTRAQAKAAQQQAQAEDERRQKQAKKAEKAAKKARKGLSKAEKRQLQAQEAQADARAARRRRRRSR
ncbi:hypothetical protein PO878_10735 [Iamia majanohamensis]|uniref:Uncharacterized protein n=1 Tax=Iamia majanohamensis TaxID=467976 RepID=A0AAE9YDW7_9ACTN|nr:hypothetical protein [Iamia majanohamensis]WCO69198.1 hypothetical protein PO878_10735 [Iamia majanohamensis]